MASQHGRGSLVPYSAKLLKLGTPPSSPDDSRYVLRGRSGVYELDVRIWPGLTVERMWRVRENGEDRLIRIECSVVGDEEGLASIVAI